MIVLNQQTAHNLMTGGLSAGGTGGVVLWLQQNYNLASLGIVAFVALVGAVGQVINFYFKRLENERDARESALKEALLEAKIKEAGVEIDPSSVDPMQGDLTDTRDPTGE